MSKGRGNTAQRRQFAAVREIAEAAGITCRLDCSKSGGTQHAVLTWPDGIEVRIAIHGTPSVVETALLKIRQRTRKRIRERQFP